ncbi:MFS transporter [Ruminococcus sp.]|uniref:MFS transporter n=1 Tax=Ruminococcus sp. TaxID=41978 RepID=UPI00258C337F|nr:MFS transporter [Ruminococcus sp.]MCR5021530.1 hypothetical protein [Ruminococcus sp.]
MNNIKKLYAVQILSSVSIWTTLVCCIWNIGYCGNITPVRLGVMSFCFSGAMALFNGIMSAVLRPTTGKAAILAAAAADILVNLLMHITPSDQKRVFVYIFLTASCFSIISIAKDKLLASASAQSAEKSEKIFKLLRFTGPILGGIITGFATYERIMLINILFLFASAVIAITLEKPQDDTEKEKQETRYIASDKYDKNRNLFTVFLSLTFIVTICIQMVDAQLAEIFRAINNASAQHIGLCIGISGIGVFIISTFLERYFVKESFFQSGIAAMGILMAGAGIYFKNTENARLAVVFLIFMLGGICWQTVMSTLENIIKSVRDNSMVKYFSAVGMIVIFSYSAGALASGFIVDKIGIASMYILIGIILIMSAIAGKILTGIVLGRNVAAERRSEVGRSNQNKRYNQGI